MKKLVVFIVTLVFIFLLFLFFYFKKHDYNTEYIINEININESYDKENALYKFELKYKDKNYEVISKEKYINKRRLISNVNISELNDEVCLSFESKYLSLYSVCSNKDGYHMDYSNDNNNFEEKYSYKNIKISDTNNKYLLWNYNGFIYLNNKNNLIELFQKDIYNLNLIYSFDNYLLVPDYDQEYKFKKIYIINSDNGKVKELKLRYEIYFDSYFLGHDNNKIYIFDNKEEQEYYIDLKKNEIYKTTPKILDNEKWIKTTAKKLKNNKLTFSNKIDYNYNLKDNKLYFKAEDTNIDYLVTNKKVDKIVKVKGYEVFYISEDILYYFDPFKGNIPMLKYSEWKFNNTNMIFIF